MHLRNFLMLTATLVGLTVFPTYTLADTDIQWFDYEDARESKSDKPVFVFGEATFCPACKKMKQEVFSQNDIAVTLNNDFVPVKMTSLGIFPNKLNDIKDVNGEQLTLMGTPAYVIIKGNKYGVFYGYKPASEMRALLDSVVSG